VCARLLCAPLSVRVAADGLAGQWCKWMTAGGLAVVRLSLNALPADENLFSGLIAVLLRCTPEEAAESTCPRIYTPSLVPAFFAACARAPLELQARQLETFALWLRLCPDNCGALTATASLWQPHAAAMLAAALDEKAVAPVATLCGTLLVELLCTYSIETLAAELGISSGGAGVQPLLVREASGSGALGTGGSWRALDVILVVAQGCGDAAQVQRARRMLLQRLLESMVRLGPRFGEAAAAAAPKLLRLCVVVRAHLYTPPPPPPPVAARLEIVRDAPARLTDEELLARYPEEASMVAAGVPRVEILTGLRARTEHLLGGAAAVRLSLATRPPYDAAALSSEQRWDALRTRGGEAVVHGDAELLLQLLETFDALTVRAMMDDAADAAMRKRTSAATFGLGVGGQIVAPSTPTTPQMLLDKAVARRDEVLRKRDEVLDSLNARRDEVVGRLSSFKQGIAGRLRGASSSAASSATPVPPPPHPETASSSDGGGGGVTENLAKLGVLRDLVVSGAGLDVCNGFYGIVPKEEQSAELAALANGKPLFRNANGAHINWSDTDWTRRHGYPAGIGCWGIGYDGHHRYMAPGESAFPPGSGWVVRQDHGVAPAPKIARMSSQASQQALLAIEAASADPSAPAFIPAPPPHKAPEALDALMVQPMSVFDVLLELLLLLVSARAATLGQPQAAKARAATAQRLREILWRDLEQGCTWAHLPSQQAVQALTSQKSDDQVWQARRAHVFELVVSLGMPLREHACALRAGTATYHAALAETLVPLLQGVMRTFRYFIAYDLTKTTKESDYAKQPPADYDDYAASKLRDYALGADGGTGYGQLTVLVGQLGGQETPAWMLPEVEPSAFLSTALAQWTPLLDALPLAAAARARRARQRTDVLHAVLSANAWADAALSGWMQAAAEEESLAAQAVAQADGALSRLRQVESKRAAAADAKEKAEAAHAAHMWEAVQRTLLREQAAWEEPGSSGGARFWEHLEVEDTGPGRRRPLVVPNPLGTDHKQASLTQQKSGGSRAWPISAPAADDPSSTADGPEGSVNEGSVAALRRVASMARQATGGSSIGKGGEEGEGEEGEADEESLSRTASIVAGAASAPASDTAAPLTAAAADAAADDTERASDETSDDWLFNGPCDLVWRGGVVVGIVTLTRTALTFEADPNKVGEAEGKASDAEVKVSEAVTGNPVAEGARTWMVAELKQMQRRRFLLTHTALEIFTAQPAAHPAYGLPPAASFPSIPLFLHLYTKKQRERLKRALQRVGVPERSWRLAKQALQDAWHRREISNFDYLMELNTLSGRTYNDLNQYPVMPWVLADYTSYSLDLSDPASYRDLSKPVGALNEARLQTFVERYNGMDEDGEMPRFHYGSHYSSAAATLFWLLRLEPYTSFAVELQSGKFDHADRLFYSLREAWLSCNTNIADVKELIPEFFYMPDFLRNASRFELGVRQDDKRVDDVVLPPWAKTPETFIAYHRRALESEVVSANLHHWIDLIWGSKQQGPAAVEAANIFFYLTYEGTVDLEAVADPIEREAIQQQVACFGQTPPILFTAPHPARRPPMPMVRPVHWTPPPPPPSKESPNEPSGYTPRPLIAPPTTAGLNARGLKTPAMAAIIQPFERTARFALFGAKTSVGLSSIAVSADPSDRRVVAVDANSAVHSFRWPPPYGRAPQVASARRHCLTQLPASDASKTSCLAIVPAPDNPRAMHVLSGGHFDGALCVADESGRTRVIDIKHSRTITCLALSPGRADWLLTGAADTTVILWYLRVESTGQREIRPVPVRALRGHVRELTAVALAADLGLAASGAADGCILLHTTRDGSLLRSIVHPDRLPVGHLLLSSLHCRLIVGSTAAGTSTLHAFTLSGVKMYTCELGGGVRCALLSPDGSLLLAGGMRGDLNAWRLDTGQPAAIFANAGSAIACACVSENDLVVGTQDGDIIGYPLDPKVMFGSAIRDVAHGFS